MRTHLVLLAVAPILAGCVGPAADLEAASSGDLGLPADPWPAVRAALGDLPCEAPVGEGTSANLAVLAEAPLDEAEGSHGELALQRSSDGARVLAALARYQSGGVDLADVTDPLAPLQIASWDPEETDRGLDVKFTTDGATLLIGGDASIKLLDVRDPAEPRLEDEYVLAKKQAHMLSLFRVAGADWVAAPKAEGFDLPIYKVVGEPWNRTLERVATPALTLLGEATGEDLLRSHDAWFEVDPTTGTPTLWIANVWDGVAALDVMDPTAPKLLAKIPNLDPHQGYTHTVQVAHLDGRRLVVAVQEVGVNAMKVWDATDLARPALVAYWHVPVAAFPQHNLQIVGDRAYVAHYKEGVFVFDLRAVGPGPVPTRLAPVAHLEAGSAPGAAAPNSPTGAFSSAFGGTWDVVVKDGLLYTSEISAGLRVTGYGCLWPGDEGASSTG